MKKLLYLLIIVLGSLSMNAQQYKLLPDSCTYCFYQNFSNYFGWPTEYYEVDLDGDTVINGLSYSATVRFMYQEELYVRQSGNKVFGVPKDSLSEYLLMDFDAGVGDTISRIFTMEPEPWFYRGIVLAKDSIELQDGSYFHTVELGVDSAGDVYQSSGFEPPGIMFNVVWKKRDFVIQAI